ncbi:FecR family protein [Fibrobacter sp. UWB15]|uniref:FecR family protein n=1 Tax=unclassified Fibrobacter TaxID=2634177 RepID=UPI00091E5FEB|nr:MULTISPECIES: FecR family protein [unclassified Fibrobacter]PWJ67586.1 FecR family protein [Fibrobacter sp. UWB6]SHF71915.1 FecR family protein [Fibrobacter sp. UWB8]SMG12689.1 FecR family protein [Fibrobacter sp. UWB15]
MVRISVSRKTFLRSLFLLAVVPLMAFSAPSVGTAFMPVKDVDRWKAKQSKWTHLGDGAKVYQSDKVRTGAESEVTIRLQDGSSLRIGEKTIVEMESLFEPNDEGGFETKIDVEKGFLNFAVHKLKNKKSKFIFKTGTATASIRGTEGYIGGEGVFFAGLKTGRLEIKPNGSDQPVSIVAGETTFGVDTLVVLKLASSGEARFAKRLLQIISDKSKSMKALKAELEKADTEFQAQLKEEAKQAESTVPENGFIVSTSSPVEICEDGLVVDGSYRTSDEAATLVLKVGNSYTSSNLIRAADGQAHSFSEKVVVNDDNGLWTADKATLEFKGAGVTSTKSIDLMVNKACVDVNTKAPVASIVSYDSLRCIANVMVSEIQNDAGVLVMEADGSKMGEETVTKNSQKRLKLQKGRHEYVVRVEDLASNKAEVTKKMGCYPNKRFPVEVLGPAKEVLKVPPPPQDIPDRITQTLQFRIRIPENDPDYLYKVTVRQNGKVILQESLSQIHNLDYQIPVSLTRGVRNHFDIEVVHKSGYISKAKKDYGVD